MLLDSQQIHIEISSRCVLKCPRCPRTELSLGNLNREIGLDTFQKAFPPQDLSSIREMIFCGHIGDPIYATDFLSVIRYIRDHSQIRVAIVTNGSYRKIEWWHELAGLLGTGDRITFSIDGWDQASNNLYRVNSDFESAIQAIQHVRKNSDCHITWSAIYFRFNQEHMHKIKDIAHEIGCDQFRAVMSTKFDGRYLVGGTDLLKPDKTSQSSVYETEVTHWGHRIDRQWIRPSHKGSPQWARCMNHKKEVFIDVDGLVLPCAWFGNGYHEHEFVRVNRDSLLIGNRTFLQIVNDPIWQHFRDILNKSDMLPEVCKIKCLNDQI